MSKNHSHNKADLVGISGSVLCLVHCLLSPALLLGSSLANEHTHHVHGDGLTQLDWIFVLINGLAVYYATKGHRSPSLRLFMWLSFSLFALSLLLENLHPFFAWAGYIGSGLLIAGHVYNLVKCKPYLLRSLRLSPRA
jgi:hypothetical protein